MSMPWIGVARRVHTPSSWPRCSWGSRRVRAVLDPQPNRPATTECPRSWATSPPTPQRMAYRPGTLACGTAATSRWPEETAGRSNRTTSGRRSHPTEALTWPPEHAWRLVRVGGSQAAATPPDALARAGEVPGKATHGLRPRARVRRCRAARPPRNP